VSDVVKADSFKRVTCRTIAGIAFPLFLNKYWRITYGF
jgi:hypothetical protein